VRWPAEAIWQAIEPLLPGFTVEILPELDSTNSELMRRGRSGRTEPALLVAERQTAGRGRMGREWHSQQGESLTFSLAMTLAPADWSGLSLAVGVCLAEALHPDVRLKWPNDLWLHDRKLGGILIETASFGDSAPAARYGVVGVGINIAPRPSGGLSTPPAALQELLPGQSAAQALIAVAQPLVMALRTFETSGFAPFQARFNARDAGTAIAEGHRTVAQCIARGVSKTGALLVHTALAMLAVTSSEVSVRPA
jgi:BirA family biotin operon repressor/biotin-[acetyl-CoA-carboxylase] ligase